MVCIIWLALLKYVFHYRCELPVSIEIVEIIQTKDRMGIMVQSHLCSS